MRLGSGTRLAMSGALALALGITMMASNEADAKSKKKRNCAAAEELFQGTGQGDLDEDGLSDCREVRQLGTMPNDPDTDDDGLMDGDEVEGRSDPRDADSDDDGFMDGQDDHPRMREQKVEGFLDALTCPAVGVLGSMKVLGTTAVVDDLTSFERGNCAELAEMLAAASLEGMQPFVEVEIAEDATGGMSAIEIETKRALREHDSDDEDDDDEPEIVIESPN